MSTFAPFFEAASEGRLLAQRCAECGELQYYPRRRCTHCGNAEVTYEEVSGRGKLYSFTNVLKYPPSKFTDDLPYTLAIVILDEGPRMLTRMVDCDPQALHCDMEVQVVFKPVGGEQPMPCFTPVS